MRDPWSLQDLRGYNKVPLGRYFFFAGGLLLAMLFIADRYVQSSPPQIFGEARVDKSIIRIKSAHKWPEPVIIDTNLPTIVPPPLPVFAKAPIVKPPQEAFARMDSPLPKISEYPVPTRAKRKVAKVLSTRLVANQAPTEATPAGW
jgi:hypothetical protein